MAAPILLALKSPKNMENKKQLTLPAGKLEGNRRDVSFYNFYSSILPFIKKRIEHYGSLKSFVIKQSVMSELNRKGAWWVTAVMAIMATVTAEEEAVVTTIPGYP